MSETAFPEKEKSYQVYKKKRVKKYLKLPKLGHIEFSPDSRWNPMISNPNFFQDLSTVISRFSSKSLPNFISMVLRDYYELDAQI